MTTDDDGPAFRFLPQDEALAGRLAGWQFGAAQALLRPDHPRGLHDLVNALVNTFGRVGVITDGTLAEVIRWSLQGAFYHLEQRRNDHPGPIEPAGGAGR